MTIRNLRVISFIALLSLTAGRYALLRHAASDGVRILIPAAVRELPSKTDSCRADVHYFNIIPPAHVDGLSGTAVVRRADSGLVSFVRPWDKSVPLRPKEILLKWRVSRDADGRVRVNFAKPFFSECVSGEKLRRMHVKYAILKVGKSGRAALAGLADKNGESVF